TRRTVWERLAAIAATRERTVFLTTHYMDEAQHCDDVAIVDHGKLVARGSPVELIARAGSERLILRAADRQALATAAQALGWQTVIDAGSVVVEGAAPEVMLARLADRGGNVREVRIVRPTLEDAFVALTGRQLRDAPAEDGARAAMGTNL